VIRSGSHTHIPLLTVPFRDRIFLDARIASVSRQENGVTLHFEDRPTMEFEQVVFACHGDQVLPLLEQPTDTGRIGCLLAFWDICSACDLAWEFANHLNSLSGITRDDALSAQDSLTGVLGRAILAAA
jgi:hypothetical protein